MDYFYPLLAGMKMPIAIDITDPIKTITNVFIKYIIGVVFNHTTDSQ